jgi:hypothetical protein
VRGERKAGSVEREEKSDDLPHLGAGGQKRRSRVPGIGRAPLESWVQADSEKSKPPETILRRLASVLLANQAWAVGPPKLRGITGPEPLTSLIGP